MPIIRDGEKFACKQCIQGHRVSGCNHVDRPLQHVNKKGRPVSQCPHCRGLRRSRQSHIKCDCGDRRHSRNASSESAATSLADEEGSCKCAFGKKCICNVKKEVSDADSTLGLPGISPQKHRSSAMRWIPPRRSESAVPSMRNTLQAHHYSNSFGASDLGMLDQAGHPYQLGARHMGQRSVDSLPLSSSATQYQPPMTNPSYDHQFLNPEYAVQQQMPVPQAPNVGMNDQMSNEFPVRLDQTIIDRTLSPHNTKRYSMNDFSMLAGMSQPIPNQQLLPNSIGPEPQPFVFPEQSTPDFGFPVFGASAAQNPPPTSVASTEFTFPALSRSSSGTTSEQGESMFMNPLANSSQPLITIDPSWSFQQNYEPSEKSAANFDLPPSTYHGTPSEYASPFGDPVLPVYDLEGGNNGVNPFSTEPPSGGLNNFPTPGSDYSPRDDFSVRGLPDRSAGNFNSSPQMGLGLDFRFPNDDMAASENYGSPLRQGWSPMTDATAFSVETN